MYNLDPIFAANNTMEIIAAVNTSTNGVFFTLIMISIYIILLIRYHEQSWKAVSLVCSFIWFMIALYGYSLEWIGMPILIIPIILTFVSLILVFIKD